VVHGGPLLHAEHASARVVEHMTVQRMEHVGIVVDDPAAATAFLVELGLDLQASGRSGVVTGWTA
jgi:hypothetical protein